MKRNEVRRRQISRAIGLLEDRYIQEAAEYRPGKEKKRRGKMQKIGLAAACFTLLAALALVLKPGDGAVAAYAQGMDGPLTESGAALHTGTIDDQGIQTGHPLFFYLSGQAIDRVRFSCKNQKICFVDWTETRPEFGNAQNFTVDYGPDPAEYAYLLVDWVPEDTIRALHDPDARIADLPPELRQDVIVMEIRFADGRQQVKAITVELTEEGDFFAAFKDYEITDRDDFVRRPDAEPVPREILYGPAMVLPQDQALERLEQRLIEAGYAGEGMRDPEGEPYFWQMPIRAETIEGQSAYGAELLFGPGAMYGRLYGSFAVSQDGSRFWHYDQAAGEWQPLT